MSDRAVAWLGGRHDAPPALHRRLLHWAAEAPADEAPLALGEAALAALARALELGSARSAALELLAADALITYACEAAAEAGPDAVERVLDACSPAAFAPLLERRA